MSCVQFVHSRIPSAPLVDAEWFQQFPRSTPSVGSIAMFKYDSGVSHVAIVEELQQEGMVVSECNYRKGVCDKRFVKWNNDTLVGFWQPPSRYRAASPSEALAASLPTLAATNTMSLNLPWPHAPFSSSTSPRTSLFSILQACFISFSLGCLM